MHLVRRLALIAAAALVASLPPLGVSQMTSFTAASVNAGGSPISGKLCLTAVDRYGTPISITRQGGGYYKAGAPFCGNLAAGALSAPISAPNSCTDSAAGHGYQLIIYDALTHLASDPQVIFGICGATWALDTYIPSVTVPSTNAFTLTAGTSVPSGSCVFPALYTQFAGSSLGTVWVCGQDGQWHAAASAGPSGSVGPAGPSATVSIGTVTTLSPGSPATVANGGSSSAAVFNFGIPQGVAGIGAGGSSDSLDILGTINNLPVQEFLTSTHPPLAYWDAGFHNCKNQIIGVNVHGTSRSIVDTTVVIGGASSLSVTFPNRWVNRLGTQLMGMCALNGFNGLHALGVPFRWATGATGSYAAQGMNNDFFVTTGSFTTGSTAIGPYQGSDSMVIQATSNGASIAFTPQLPDGSGPMAFDHIRMYCESGPGLNAWTINVDGAAVGTCGGSSSNLTATLGVSSAVALATHNTALVCATQPCAGYKVDAVAGTTGVNLNNYSVGSASAEIIASNPSTQYAFENIDPDPVGLDIIEHVCNEPGNGISTSQFQTTLNNIITHDRALSYPPSILFVGELQDGISNQAPYYPIFISTAKSNNVALVDMRDRWGTAMAPALLFGPDGYHESNAGNGEVYSAVASTIIDVPASASSLIASKLCPTGSYINSFSGGVFGCSALPATCGNGFAHYAPITIANSSVVGGTDLINYPALLSFNGASANSITLANLKTVSNGGQVQQSTGADVIFCSAATGGSQLSHELVAGTYTPSTGAGEWYINLPDVSATAATTVYAFWGAAGASDTSNVAGVWANGYVGVYHFGNGSTLSLADSSGHGNYLTNYGATTGAGSAGGGISLTSGNYAAKVSPGFPAGAAQRTMEAWVNLPSLPSNAVLLGYGNYSTNGVFEYQYTPASPVYGYVVWSDDGPTATPTTTFASTAGAFHSIAVSQDATGTTPGLTYVFDGTPSPANCLSSCTASLATVAAEFRLNGIATNGALSTNEVLDEVRISNVARTTGWLATQYLNQSNPGSFFTLGTIH